MDFCRHTYGVRAASLSDLEVSDSVGFLVAAPKFACACRRRGRIKTRQARLHALFNVSPLDIPAFVVCLSSPVDYEIPRQRISHLPSMSSCSFVHISSSRREGPSLSFFFTWLRKIILFRLGHVVPIEEVSPEQNMVNKSVSDYLSPHYDRIQPSRHP